MVMVALFMVLPSVFLLMLCLINAFAVMFE